MKTRLILLFTILVFLPSFAFAQTVDDPEQQYQYQTIDEDALTQRVDDLTEAVNTHTDQIEALAERVKTLESKPVAVQTVRRNQLGTQLKTPKPLAVVSSTTVTTVSPPVVVSSPVVQAPQATVNRSRTVQRTVPAQVLPRLGSRPANFYVPGNCPGGWCPVR